MKKIPTVYVRDDDTNRRYVKNEPAPGCEWVFLGEGVPTRKFDGSCVFVRRDGLAVQVFARREVKAGKNPPPNFVEVEHDATTGKTVGWEPAAQSGFGKWIDEAVNADDTLVPGTYELCGPKVNGNPERFDRHVLVSHDTAQVVELGFDMSDPDAFSMLWAWLHHHPYEGIVWHHPDGRMAKIKARDFPRSETDQ